MTDAQLTKLTGALLIAVRDQVDNPRITFLALGSFQEASRLKGFFQQYLDHCRYAAPV